MRIRFASLLATLTLVLVLSVGFVGLNGAVAAPGGGAETSPGPAAINIPPECYDFGLLYCFEANGMTNVVSTPSGNVIYQVHLTYCYTATDPTTGDVLYQDCQSQQIQSLAKDGEAQVYHQVDTGSFGSSDETCTYSSRFHMANGQVQYEDSTFECS